MNEDSLRFHSLGERTELYLSIRRGGGTLRGMLTKEDKEWVEESLKSILDGVEKRLEPIRDSIDLLEHEVARSSFEKFSTRTDIDAIKASIIRIERTNDKILGMQDGYASKVGDLELENKAGAVILHRHDVQIHELASATGTKISD